MVAVIAALELAASRTRIPSDKHIMRQAIREIREKQMSEATLEQKFQALQAEYDRLLPTHLETKAENDRLRAQLAAMKQKPSGHTALLELALEASPGPWHWDADPVKNDPLRRSRAQVVALGRTITQAYYTDGQGEKDAAFIAAANPSKVISLLTALAQAEADKLAAVRRAIEAAAGCALTWGMQARIRALSADEIARGER